VLPLDRVPRHLSPTSRSSWTRLLKGRISITALRIVRSELYFAFFK
jgi:hypothetical protein